MQQGNYEAAKFHFAGFGQLTDVNFPYQLLDIMIDLKKGDVQTGLKKAKVLSDDPTVPKEMRVELKKIIAEVEKKGGNVNSKLFWPKIISSIIIDELKTSSQKGIHGLMDLVVSTKEKLK